MTKINHCPVARKRIKAVPLPPESLQNMNDYRFINIDQEPTEAQLAQLMHEVAVEAKERYARAHKAFFAQIDQMMSAQ